MTNRQAAEISEAAARYFCGWKPGVRRFPVFEAAVRAILAGTAAGLLACSAYAPCVSGGELRLDGGTYRDEFVDRGHSITAGASLYIDTTGACLPQE